MKMPDISMPHFSKLYFETSDFRQVYTIAKNETIKNVRGKRFLVSLVIIVLIFALITLMPIMLGTNIKELGYGGWGSNYLSYVTMFVAIIAALIGSVALVSEYEERTALILFTRPVKKTTIFVGKLISSFVLCAAMMVVYYLGILIVGYFYFPQPSVDLLESFAMCLMYVFAAICIAFMFSAIFKRSAVAIIATILTLIAVIPIISMMINGDKWFMLDIASNSTLTCIPEYVETYNKAVHAVELYFQDIMRLLEAGVARGEVPQEYIDWTIMVRDIILKYMAPLEDPTLWKDALVMFTWGAIALIASWILFLRKQF